MDAPAKQGFTMQQNGLSSVRSRWRDAARLGYAILRGRLTGAPIILSHLVTTRCNCICETCLWRGLGDGDELTADQIAEVYRDAANGGIVLLTLWGGEPLLRVDLPQIVAQAAQAGLQPTLITSCVRLPERLDELAPHLRGLICSLDAPGPLHDRMRGCPGLCDRVIESIRLAQRNWPHVRVMINAVVSRLNEREVSGLVRLAKDLGVGIYVHPIETGWAGSRGAPPPKGSLALPPQRLSAVFSELLAMKRAGWPVNNSATYLRFIAQGRTHYRCHARKVYIEMRPNGDFVDCLDRSRPAANVRQRRLRDLLADPAIRRLRMMPTDCHVCRNANVVDCSNVWSLRPEPLLSLLRLYMRN
jgi:MoaA/NifB/PqqE/SkfB family radical SAM enzyme